MSDLVFITIQRRIAGSFMRKAVLLYMARQVDDDGTGFCESKMNMARDLEVSDRGIRKTIRGLVDDGLVLRVGKGPRANGRLTEYSINLDAVERLPVIEKPVTSEGPYPWRGTEA